MLAMPGSGALRLLLIVQSDTDGSEGRATAFVSMQQRG
jgi:hypothetical protein